MQGKEAGLVSGKRWYAPQAGGWGSLVRYIYSACRCTHARDAPDNSFWRAIPKDTQVTTLTLRDTVRLVAALAVVLATITLASRGAACARAVEWSGIRYVITKAGRLKLMSYHPLRSPAVSKPNHAARSTARG